VPATAATLSPQAVQDLFTPHPVSDVEIKQDAAKQQLHVYVSFHTAADAEAALASCNGTVPWAADGTTWARVVPFAPTPGPASAPARSSSAQSTDRSNPVLLHVSNLDVNTTEEELVALFAPYFLADDPRPTLLRKLSSNVAGQMVCYGTVAFTSRANAERAILGTSGTDFLGRRIRVEFFRHNHSGRSTPVSHSHHGGDERYHLYDNSYRPPVALTPSPVVTSPDQVISIFVQYSGAAVNHDFFVNVFSEYGVVTGVYIKGCTSGLDVSTSSGYAGRCVTHPHRTASLNRSALSPPLHSTAAGHVGTRSCTSRTTRPAAAPRSRRAA